MALALVLGACGGGGGSGSVVPETPVDPSPPGIHGTLFLDDVDLGLIAEQEPNDSRAQSCRLPPISPRVRLRVTGLMGTTAAWFGRADPVDVLTMTPQATQDVALALAYTPVDPVGSGANDVIVEVFESGGSVRLAVADTGNAPRTTAFRAEGGRDYDLVLTCRSGHATWTLTLQTSDPSTSAATTPLAMAPKPPSERATDPDLKGVSTRPEPGADVADSFSRTRVLVRLGEGSDAQAFAARQGVDLGRRTALGTWRVLLPEAQGTRTRGEIEGWCERLRADEAVDSVEPDHVVRPLGLPNDAELARQWNLHAVGAPGAWEITRGSRDIVVGVVDSGIVSHPDLEGQLAAGYDFVEYRPIAADGDPRDPDPTDVGAEDLPSGRSSWHGTHVAAIIAAKADDGYGITGVAPGCRVMPLRAIGVNGGYVSDVVDAILYAAGLYTTEDGYSVLHRLPVVNLSFGTDVDVDELRNACLLAYNRGVLLVGAAGNTGQGVLYPAAYSTVVAVAAVDRGLEKTKYSCYGWELDLAAPGGLSIDDAGAAGWPDSILSCVLDDTVYPKVAHHGYLQGTSQAAPHVSAVAALLLSIDPTLERQRLKDILVGGAMDRGEVGKDIATGWGIVQAQASMRILLEELGTPLSTPPSFALTQTSVRFVGFENRKPIAVLNAGAGRLTFGTTVVETDDGGDWLSTEYELAPGPTGPSEVTNIVVVIDRFVLPPVQGTYSGTIRVRDDADVVLGSIRVVVYVDQRPLAGGDLTVLVRSANSGALVAYGTASPGLGYRYWFPKLGSGSYKVMGGTDVDGDGFACEGSDACGWYGGATEAEALPLILTQLEKRLDADVLLRKP